MEGGNRWRTAGSWRQTPNSAVQTDSWAAWHEQNMQETGADYFCMNTENETEYSEASEEAEQEEEAKLLNEY